MENCLNIMSREIRGFIMLTDHVHKNKIQNVAQYFTWLTNATAKRVGEHYDDLEPKDEMRKKRKEGKYLFYQLLLACLMETKDWGVNE